MQFAATITRKDVARMSAYILFRNRVFWFLAALLYIFALWGQWHSDQRPNHWFHVIYFMVLYAVIVGSFYLAIIAYFVIVTVFHTATRKGVLGEHTYEIRPNGFFETTAFTETLTKWAAIPRVARTSKTIIVQQSWWLFHIIPRRAFADDSAYNAFFQELQAHIQSHETA